MINKGSEIQQIKVLLEIQFKSIEKQLKEYDRNILKLMEKINSKRILSVYDSQEEVEIKVRSYMDNDLKV